ncbi:hypothetical protein J6590_085494 [Homalodisca vitripennis]|nr:hypothetical protein J6590_085494 [Homalodisca vitripennis]
MYIKQTAEATSYRKQLVVSRYVTSPPHNVGHSPPSKTEYYTRSVPSDSTLSGRTARGAVA